MTGKVKKFSLIALLAMLIISLSFAFMPMTKTHADFFDDLQDAIDNGNGTLVFDSSIYSVASEDGLRDALADESGKVKIQLDSHIALEDPIAIPVGVEVALDLNGYELSYDGSTQGEAMIVNKGTLTIKDSEGTGVINYDYKGEADPSFGKGNYTISNAGNLTIDGGKITIANLSRHAKYPIDNNSTTGDAVLVINGGHLYNYNTSAIRMFANSTVYKNSVTINGGLIEGYCSIWMQNPGDSVVNADLTISAGELKTTAKAYVEGTAELKDVSSKMYCTIAGAEGSWSEDSYINISGGKFNENVSLSEDVPATIIVDKSKATFNGTYDVVEIAKIGDVSYATLEDAVAQAKAGDTITMLSDVTLSADITLPAGITFNGNGKSISGTIFAAGDLTFEGHTKVTNFNAGYNKPVVTIDEGACLELTGTGRMVIGHGATFNITGNITDAKTANTENLNPSLIAAGASFTGAGVNFNLENAYVKFTNYCSSKNSNANNTFNFNITNSIWEQTGSLVFTVPTNGMNPTFNFNLKDSVLNSTSHLVFAVSNGEIVFDNSNVNVGMACQIENRSTMTVKNGSIVNGAVATSQNAINPGTLIVDNATYVVTGEFSGSSVGVGTIIVNKDATFAAGKITKANVVIDATGMAAGDTANITANLSNFEGTLEVVNNNSLTAEIVDGKIVLAAKPVAEVGGVQYATLKEAVAAANDNDTITLLDNVALDATLTISKPITIEGNGKTITTSESFVGNASNAMLDIQKAVTFSNVVFDGVKNVAVMRSVSADVKIDNCIVQNSEHTVAQGLLRFACCNVTITNSQFLNNNCTMVVTFGYDAANDTDVLLIDGCTFEGNTAEETAIVYFAAGDYGKVTDTKFVGNTVSSAGNAATLYMGWGEGYEVSGCYFENNTVTTTHTTTKRFASAIFADGCTIKENAFVNNTATRGDGPNGATVAVAAYYGAADVSANYWDGNEPDYTVEYTRKPVANTSYYKSCVVETNGELTLSNKVEFVAAIGEVKYETLQAAFAAANGGTVVLLRDITIDSTVEVTGTAVLDLNGYTVSMEDASSKAAYLIKNTGNLTIKDSSVEKSGKLTFVSTTPSANYGYSTSTIANAGTLTVESGTIENTTNGGASYAIDTAWYVSNVTLNINGGHIKSNGNAVRQVLYSTTAQNTVNVTGGVIEGEYAALQTHNFQKSACLADVNISGGQLIGSYTYYTSYSYANGHEATDIEISGGEFDGYVYIYNGIAGSNSVEFLSVAIKGGTFSSEVYVYTKDAASSVVAVPSITAGTFANDVSDYCAEGFEVFENGDGTYGVQEKRLEGEGTEETPYLIATVDDLILFRDSVNSGKFDKGAFFKLTENIDLAASTVATYALSRSVTANWTPIGTKDAPFQGEFDGNGKTISNLIVVGGANQGYFGYANFATIKNLNIVNATVIGTDCVGAIAGQVYSQSLIEKCHVSGNIQIQGQTNVGGIVGKYYTKVTNCSVIGDGVDTSIIEGVYVESDLEGDNVGGIMGHGGENNNFEGNTVKNITISGTRKVGGIVGTTDKQTDLSKNVVENVKIYSTATVDYAASKTTSMTFGGLIGHYYGTSTGGALEENDVSGLTFGYENEIKDYFVAGAIVGGSREEVGKEPAGVTYSGNTFANVNGATNEYLLGYVAAIGEVKYLSLADAIANAEDGDTVTLLSNIEVTGTIVVDKGITIDLNEKKITNVGGTANHTFRIAADVAIVGNGTIDNTAGGYAFIVGYNTPVAGNLVIESGSFYGNTTVVSLTYGTVTVNGGYFEATPYNGGYDYTFNCVDRFYQAGNAKIIINGGTFYKYNPSDNAAEGANTNFCPTGYAGVVDADGNYGVGVLPNADVLNLGLTTIVDYNVYNGSLVAGGDPISLTVAMQFLANDTEEEANANAFGNYTTDFYITIDGMEGDSFVANGCYLAGNYGTFGWIMIPLDGMVIENGKIYPVISSVGFDFKYVDICASVKDFKCGIYLSEEILAANPDLTVSLELGLSENMEAAQAADSFVTVDKPYVYDVEDLKNEVVVTTAEELQAALVEGGKKIILGNDITFVNNEYPKVEKDTILDLNGHKFEISKAWFDVVKDVTFTVKDSANGGEIKTTFLYEHGWGSVDLCGSTFVLESGIVDFVNVYEDNSTVIVVGGTLKNVGVNEDITSVSGVTFNFDPADVLPVEYESVKINNTTWGIQRAKLVFIGETGYYTLEEALNAAQAGDVIEIVKAGEYELICGGLSEGRYYLPANLTIKGVDGVVVTNNPAISAESITIDNVDFVSPYGNALTFYLSGNSAIKNSRIESPNGTYYSCASGTLAIDNCNIIGTHTYGLHIAEGNADVTVTNSTIGGWNTYGSGITASFNNVTFKDDYGYAFLGFYKDATIENCKFEESMEICSQSDSGVTITINNSIVVDDAGNEVSGSSILSVIDEGTLKGANDTIIIDGKLAMPVMITDSEGNSVKYATLADAIAAAEDNDVIVVLADVEVAETLKVAGKAITLDLNGKVVSGSCNAGQGHLIMVNNDATLVIKDSVGEGKITYAQGLSNTGWVIDLEGALVLESGTIELTGDTWSIGYAVDVRPNAWGTAYANPTIFTMNGGALVSSDGAVRVASSSSHIYSGVSAAFVMNGGKIDAAWDGVFIQQSDGAYDVLTFTMNGGKIEAGLNPVRVYGPAPTSYVNGQDCMNVTLNGGELTYTGTEEREWIIDKVVRVGGGMTASNIVDNGGVVVSAAMAQSLTVAEGLRWVEKTEGKYELAEINYVAAIGEVKYETLQAAIDAATDGAEIYILCDLTESIAAFENVVLKTNVDGGVTITNTYSSYADFNGVVLGSGVTLSSSNILSSGADSINVIVGTLNVSGVYYNRYDSKTTVQNGGKVITGGMTIVRYNSDPNAGIYVYGDGDATTVEFTCNGDAIGVYSGTFYAKDAVIESDKLWIDFYKSESNQEADTYVCTNVVFDNSVVNLKTQLRLYKDANLTLNGATINIGYSNNESGVQIRENAEPVVNMDANSVINATNVVNLPGAKLNAVLNENNTVSFVKFVAQIGNVGYATLQAAFAAATNGAEIVLLSDIILADATESGDKAIVIGNVGTITLNLNGFDITAGYQYGSATKHQYAFDNNATLTIKGTGEINARGICNHGTLIIESGVVINAIDDNGGYAVDNHGTFVLNGGTLAAINEDGDAAVPGYYDATPFNNNSGAEATIKSGIISNVSNFTYGIVNAGTLTIENADVDAVFGAISNSGTLTVKGGTYTVNGAIGGHALYVSGGNVTVENGTFEPYNTDRLATSYSVYAVAGTVKLKDGSFDKNLFGRALGVQDSAKIIVTGGTYAADVTEFCADGYKAADNGEGMFEIVNATYFALANLALNGTIDFYFYAQFASNEEYEELKAANAYVEFVVDGKVRNTVMVSAAVYESNYGVYGFGVSMYATELSKVVTATMYVGEGDARTVVCTRVSSIKEIADYTIEIYKQSEDESSQNLVGLMESLLNYGAYAQVHFGVETDNLANENVTNKDVSNGEYFNEDVAPIAFNDAAGDDISALGATLILESETNIRAYFGFSNGKTAADYVFKVDGVVVETAYDPTYGCYVEVAKVKSTQLDKQFTVEVFDSAESDTPVISIKYSALNYAQMTISYSTDTTLLNLVKALNLYSQAADKYFA